MRGSTRVLLVNRSPDVLRDLAVELKRERCEVHTASLASRVFGELDEWFPHVVVIEGTMALLTELRARHAAVHVLVTAIDDDDERVHALRHGADDCVSRWRTAREIAARVGAVARRLDLAASSMLDYGFLQIDGAARVVRVNGSVVALTRLELDLLIHLAANPGRTFSRDELLRCVWGSSSEWQRPSTVTEHVRRIRQKLGRDGIVPTWLVAVRGVGYRFEPYAEAGVAIDLRESTTPSMSGLR